MPPGKLDLRSLVLVLIAGAIGGLLYWVVAKLTSTQLPSVFGPGIVLAFMFVGALAAAFGVFLLTTSDLNATRTYVFAVVCGLAWQPMVTATQRFATNAVASKQTAQVRDKVDQMQAATTSGNAQQLTTAVEGTASAVNDALNYSANLTDSSKKAEIIDTSQRAINTLQTSAATTPVPAVEALKDISLTSGPSGNPAVALHAIEALHTIGKDAAQNRNEAVFQKVQQSLATVAAQTKDSSVQAAARSAGSQFSVAVKF